MKQAKTFAAATILSFASVIPNASALENGKKYKDWTAKCENFDGNQYCGIRQTVKDENGNPLVDIFIRKIKADAAILAFIKVPLGVSLQAGLGVAVDRKQIAGVPYASCDPAGCNAILKLDDTMISKMKGGNKMQISMMYMGQEISKTASLSGVTKALKAL